MKLYFHIYNRGAHKEKIFLDNTDCLHFLQLLYIANNRQAVVFKSLNLNILFSLPREKLVNIKAYCLMPNHFHLLIEEGIPQNSSVFMRKLCTAYAMYYNKKYNHSGTIFQGKYKAKLIDTDDYLRYVIQYIHLNPYGIKEPNMNKSAKLEHLEDAISYSKKYPYSSFKDYLGEQREQSSIITQGPTLE